MSKNKDLIDAYTAKRPVSADWFKRARAVLGGGVGHDLLHFDIMSSTGGVVSAAHTEVDVEQATTAFEKTVARFLSKS